MAPCPAGPPGQLGDVVANVSSLRTELRKARFPLADLDTAGLLAGRPAASLPLIHFLLLDFSAPFARLVADRGFLLRARSDMRFMEAAYRVLRELLGCSPALTLAQFFHVGFAERKILLCLEALRAARRVHQELCGSLRQPASSTRLTSQVGRAGSEAEADTEEYSEEEALPVEALEASSDLEEPRTAARPFHQPEMGNFMSQPQPPPRPTPWDATGLLGPALSGAGAASTVPSADGRPAARGNDEEAALHELLESIRESLGRRFTVLEQRLESYIMDSEARTAVLESEVRILSAKLRSNEACTAALSAPSAPPGKTPESLASKLASLPGVSSEVRVGGVVNMEFACLPRHGEMHGGLHEPRLDALRWEPLNEGLRLISQEQPHPTATASWQASGGWAPAAAAGGGLPLPRAWMQGEDDARALVDGLAAKFRDTRALLSRAQEQLNRAAPLASSKHTEADAVVAAVRAP